MNLTLDDAHDLFLPVTYDRAQEYVLQRSGSVQVSPLQPQHQVVTAASPAALSKSLRTSRHFHRHLPGRWKHGWRASKVKLPVLTPPRPGLCHKAATHHVVFVLSSAYNGKKAVLHLCKARTASFPPPNR